MNQVFVRREERRPFAPTEEVPGVGLGPVRRAGPDDRGGAGLEGEIVRAVARNSRHQK